MQIEYDSQIMGNIVDAVTFQITFLDSHNFVVKWEFPTVIRIIYMY